MYRRLSRIVFKNFQYSRWIESTRISTLAGLSVIPCLNFSVFCSGVLGGAIVDKDSDSKSDDENATKEKSRAAGPVELVGPSL